MLHLFAQQGNTVVPLGSSTVDGVAVQGYSVRFSPSAIKKDLANADLSSTERQAIDHINLSKMDATLDVDGSGHLRRLGMNVSVGVDSAPTANVDETLDFSNFGAPVTVAAPPSDQVVGFQQFLQAAQAAESGQANGDG